MSRVLSLRTIHLAAALFSAATFVAPAGAQTPAPPATVVADAGIPVESPLVRSKCGGCHRPDAENRMSRISYRRASPENWQRTVERMMSINHAQIDVAEARAIVKYLSDHNGLAPEEVRPASFEFERRMIDYTYKEDKDTADLCSGCHSFGRVMSERRTQDEWGLLVAMHRGYYPLTDNQPIANGQGFRRSRAVSTEPGPDGRPPDSRQPMDKAIAHLSKAFPLVTPEWSSWSGTMTPPKLAGRWALSGAMPGKGPVYGEVVITADASAADTFNTQTKLVVARTGETITRTGKGLLYTGFQWRGRGNNTAKADETWREVMFVERNRTEMWGRWFTGAYDELGLDVKLTRLGSMPSVLGLATPSLKIGGSGTVQIFGTDLPTVTAADIDLGPGTTISRVVTSTPTMVTVEAAVAPTAKPGPRDISIAGIVKPTSLILYQKVDGLRVLPRANMARVGGIVFPKQFAQFEAVAYANGPDGKPDTDDDWPLGVVDAKWVVEEYAATFDDDDTKFVGSIDPTTGLFTPNIDGPNPERVGNRNNIGDVWVTAEYTPTGGTAVHGRAHLVVTVPVYMQWGSSEAGK